MSHTNAHISHSGKWHFSSWSCSIVENSGLQGNRSISRVEFWSLQEVSAVERQEGPKTLRGAGSGGGGIGRRVEGVLCLRLAGAVLCAPHLKSVRASSASGRFWKTRITWELLLSPRHQPLPPRASNTTSMRDCTGEEDVFMQGCKEEMVLPHETPELEWLEPGSQLVSQAAGFFQKAWRGS